MNGVKPYPAGHYRLGYVRQSLQQLRETRARLELLQPSTSVLVDMAIVSELIRKREQSA